MTNETTTDKMRTAPPASPGKKFYKSKTFWVNVMALASIVIQSRTGFVIPPELQAGILTVLNGILRFSTTEPIEK